MSRRRWVARWLFFVAMYAQFRPTYGPTAPERGTRFSSQPYQMRYQP